MDSLKDKMQEYLRHVGFVPPSHAVDTIIITCKYPSWVPWRYIKVVQYLTSSAATEYALEWERVN